MKTLELIAAGFLLTMSSTAFANLDNSQYKMVVIKDTPGVEALQSGDTEKGVEITKSAEANELDHYTRNLNLCVGYTKLAQFDEAEKACSAAVASSLSASLAPSADIRAYAFNNRGVMKLMANDNLGALEDFKRAAKATDNVIYKYNLTRLETALNSINTASL
ncbi:hypothetical protein [Shewanella psychrotolerans]|uniref:hypothetical protein n=1 Tax=Shewanella psychrotolerans TaxID=2864206 RepID=UPI001C6621BE|nr:hypothetical protein [Shewanella psychrotolerans]QYK01813.1 hypothetical protein K0I62_02195 [Shewanella psychrotolerans]